jgi:hypothetical protein
MASTLKPQVNIKATDEALVPRYANAMQVSHTKEEFILDFIHLAPPHGILNSRVVVSPGHLKRMIKALDENLKRYEKEHGSVGTASEPGPNEIGFQST